jgi:hypothetical protein
VRQTASLAALAQPHRPGKSRTAQGCEAPLDIPKVDRITEKRGHFAFQPFSPGAGSANQLTFS